MFQQQQQRRQQRREQKRPAPTQAQLRQMERRAFDLVNAERRKAKLKPLQWSEEVAQVARAHSQRMADANFFDHTDPRFGDVGDRLNRFGVRWQMCGENIFTCNGFRNPESLAVREWMKSRGHRDNILTKEFTHSAIGLVYRSDGSYYFTQIFIRPPQTVG